MDAFCTGQDVKAFFSLLECAPSEAVIEFLTSTRKGKSQRILEVFNDVNSELVRLCAVCAFGMLDILQHMDSMSKINHGTKGDMMLMHAHFTGQSDIEAFLRGKGCKLDRNSRSYKICNSVALGNFSKCIELLKNSAKYSAFMNLPFS